MPFDCERGFITKLLETKDMLTVKDSQIKLSFFSGENKTAFHYISDVTLDTGEVPTVRAFQRKFPHYELETYKKDGEYVVGTEENLKFWCGEVRKRVKHNSLADTLEDVAKDLEGLKTEEAYSKLKKEIAYIESEVTETSAIDITKNTQDRINIYLERKKNKGMRGIPTGFKHLDYIMKGLEKETLTTLIATTGTGKSWIEFIIGARCQLANYRVLQLATEMPQEQIQDRYEAILFSLCYKGFSYNQFKSGMLPTDVEKQYFEFLENDMPDFEPLILDTATSAMGVSAQIDKYKPDIVLIDSAYLMEDDEGADSDWLRITHITRDLKKLAKRAHLPIFINSQADKNTSRKTGPDLGSISYSQSIGMDSDNVLAAYRNELMINDRETGLKVLKQREGTLGKMVINWDFDCMDFSEIYAEQSEESPQDSDEDEDAKNTIDME